MRRHYAQIHATSSIGFVETRLPRKSGLAFLWCLLTQADNFVKTALKLVIPLTLGYTIICDRYVLDLLVEGMADLHDSSDSRRIGYRILRLLPRANIAFFIDVDAALAFSRKPDLPSLSHFVERVSLYRELAKTEGVRSLNGIQSPENIHREIWSQIRTALKTRGGP